MASMHPLRLAVLAELEQGPASPVTLSRALAVSLPLVAYHVRELVKAGALELDAEIPRRGAIEHVYRLAVNGGGPDRLAQIARQAVEALEADRVPSIKHRRAIAAALRAALPEVAA